MYFLRFTTSAKRDLKRGYSYHSNDEGKRQKLSGLCGFELSAETLEEAIEEAKERFADMNCNRVYNIESFGKDWAIYKGVMLEEYLPDGDLFKADSIEYKP